MGFDARAAKQLQPGKHIVVDGFAGLRLVASVTVKSWIYRYDSAGLMKQIKLGQWPALSLSGAIAKWQELKDARASGVDPAAQKKESRKAKAPAYTVLDAVEGYIKGHLQINREPKGAGAVAARLREGVAPIASLAASDITRRIAFDLIDSHAARPVAAKSLRNELAAAWSLALDAGRLSEDTPNWWRQVLAGKLRSKGAVRDGVHKGTAKRVLSDSEIHTLFAVDMARFSQQVQDFLVIQLLTCTRGAEIVQMHHTQITQEGDGWWWTVPKALTKGAKNPNASDLRVPLVGRALEVVRRIDCAGWLFPSTSRGGLISHQVQTYMQSKVNYLQPYCKSRPDHIRQRLTVTHWSPHDLRRTGRTGLAAMGCPTDVAESILGHVQPGIQGTYNVHKYDSERRHWLQLWSNRIELLIPAAVGHGQV